jgi:acyl dehydratase
LFTSHRSFGLFDRRDSSGVDARRIYAALPAAAEDAPTLRRQWIRRGASSVVGNLGFSEIAFPKPVFHGDTLYAETKIVEKRESKSCPGEGIATFAHIARNQHGEVVATAVRKTMVRKRPEGQ